MKIYILLLLLLVACSTIESKEEIPQVQDINIRELTETSPTQNITLKSKYEGVNGVFNFTEFRIEDCTKLIKHYNLVLAEEDSRLNKRKFNIRNIRVELKQAIGEYDRIKNTLDDLERSEFEKRIQNLNLTAINKENELLESKQYFVKVKFSLRLIEEECKRLSPN